MRKFKFQYNQPHIIIQKKFAIPLSVDSNEFISIVEHCLVSVTVVCAPRAMTHVQLCVYILCNFLFVVMFRSLKALVY